MSRDDEVECHGVDTPVYVDSENKLKFYKGYKVGSLLVNLGDCVKISLENNKFGYGQVLAIYEDKYEEMFIENRWFQEVDDLKDLKDAKSFIKGRQILSNELFESNDVDIISAGSVLETITVKDFSNKPSEMSGDCFVCRYHFSVFVAGAKNTFQHVTMDKLFDRGMEYSEFERAYLDYRAEYTYNHQRDVYSLAIQRLHISVIPENLPCRSKERQEIEEFIRGGIVNGGAARPMYICGTPGTGKTATVTSILKALEQEARENKIPQFKFVEINCLRMKTPQDAYIKLWRGISGQHASSKLAVKQLKTHFDDRSYNSYNVLPHAGQSKQSSSHNKASAAEPVMVCLLDELDFLFTRDFDVIYDFFNWPSLLNSRIVVVSIANTMNISELLAAKVASRAALHQMRVIFNPYDKVQIQEILEMRLGELKLDFLTTSARNFIAIKASSVAGDLRAALKICQQVIELYRNHQEELALQQALEVKKRSNKKQRTESVTEPVAVVSEQDSNKFVLSLISEAVRAYRESPFIASVMRSTQLDKAVLIILTKFRRQGAATGVMNDDEASSDSDLGMTSAQIRDVLVKMTGEIVNGSIMTSGRGMDYSTSGTTVGTAAAGAGSGDDSNGIFLREPPSFLFDLSLERLMALGILHRTAHRLGSANHAIYKLHESFLFSDMLAAMRDDPMAVLMTKSF